ncbi:Zinc finger CCCH domain-containing protein 7B isoform X3 [Aix galericulata]|nr:Zinc finger CCCH domain-containing protein 7B isoform X3 [Aix galericulata]
MSVPSLRVASPWLHAACRGIISPSEGRARGKFWWAPMESHRFQKNKACPEGEECRYAHGQDELTEWLDRREVLKQKLAKARKDMLLCPRDDDFGKYNFLLRDGV